MSRYEARQLTFDDLLQIPKIGSYTERHGRRLSFDEAAARLGEIVILNVSTEHHEWLQAIMPVRVTWLIDEWRLVCDRGRGHCFLGEKSFKRKHEYRGKCLPEYHTELYAPYGGEEER